MKVVINTNSEGFSLSNKAINRLIDLGINMSREELMLTDAIKKKKIEKIESFNIGLLIHGLPIVDGIKKIKEYDKKIADIESASLKLYSKEFRTNPLLIRVVEELGERANGGLSYLEVADVPDVDNWQIIGIGGNEHIVSTSDIPEPQTEIETDRD